VQQRRTQPPPNPRLRIQAPRKSPSQSSSLCFSVSLYGPPPQESDTLPTGKSHRRYALVPLPASLLTRNLGKYGDWGSKASVPKSTNRAYFLSRLSYEAFHWSSRKASSRDAAAAAAMACLGMRREARGAERGRRHRSSSSCRPVSLSSGCGFLSFTPGERRAFVASFPTVQITEVSLHLRRESAWT
jgi:hypothetical protein